VEQIGKLWGITSSIREDVSEMKADIAVLRERTVMRDAMMERQSDNLRSLEARISWLMGGLAALVVVSQMLIPALFQ